MTVISAMRFNSGMAAIVADEEISYWYRKIKMAAKLKAVSFDGIEAVVGGAGNFNLISQIYDQLDNKTLRTEMLEVDTEADAPKKLDKYSYGKIVSGLLNKNNRTIIQGYLQSRYGLNEIDFQTKTFAGGEEMHDEMQQDYRRLINFEHEFSDYLLTGLLSIVADKDGVHIMSSEAEQGAPVLEPMPYATTGSGSDAADMTLADYIEGLSRSEWNVIDPVTGLMELIKATNKAIKRNYGVGGTQHIHILSTESPVTPPGERASRLASEMVEAVERGVFERGPAHELIDSLLFRGKSFTAVEKQFWQGMGNEYRELFRRHLRGYKVFE